MTVLTDYNSHTTTYTFDVLNRLLTKTPDVSGSTNYTYDTAGKLASSCGLIPR
jgi:hypothetical protein